MMRCTQNKFTIFFIGLSLRTGSGRVGSQKSDPCPTLAGIPRRRHGYTDTDSDSSDTSIHPYVRYARFPREDPREETACVGRKTVAAFDESVSVSVSVSASAPWNASFIYCE